MHKGVAQKLSHQQNFEFWIMNAYTAGVPHSRTIAILWYDFRSLWPKKKMLKSHATPLSFWLQIGID